MCTCNTKKIAGAALFKTKGKGANKRVEVNLGAVARATIGAGLGYGISNVATAKIEETINANRSNEDKINFNGNVTGGVKFALAAATVWAGGKYGGNMSGDLVNFGVGMGASGVRDILSQNLPETAKTALGISGAMAVKKYYMNDQTRTRLLEQRREAAQRTPPANRRKLISYGYRTAA